MGVKLLILLSFCFANLPTRLTNVNDTKPSTANKRLVYFWATWCTNCAEKLVSTLPKFQTKHTDVEVTTVNLDDELERVKHYLKKQKVALPVLFDPQNKLNEELNISAVPFWIVYKRTSATSDWKKIDGDVALDLDRIEKSLSSNK